MLRIQTLKSAGAIVQYLNEEATRKDGPSRGTYYEQQDRSPVVLAGRSAERLGFSGPISADALEKLARNQHPLTGERLTQRSKSRRRDGFDFVFNLPKEYSIQLELAPDPAAWQGTRAAVQLTMAEVEKHAQCRVRAGGRNADRVTANLAWAECLHRTSCPVDGRSDLHVHFHEYVPNATYDAV